MGQIDRRRFILWTIAPLAASITDVHSREDLRRVAVLIGGNDDSHGQEAFAAFREGLRQLKWIEGQNLVIEPRWGKGQAALMRAYALELVKWKPDVIVVRSATALRELRRVSGAIPVVFVQVSDPVANGFVESMARPGANITGFSNLEYEMAGKWLQLLKEIAPSVRRVLALQSANNPNWPGWLHAIESSLPAVNLQLTRSKITDEVQLVRAISDFAREPNGGLIVLPDPFLQPYRHSILDLAAKHRLPAVYGGAGFESGECLIYYGVDAVDLSRQSATYVSRILNGEKAGDLPVQAPTKFQLIVNKKVALALGLAISPSLLVRADRVIE